MEKEATVTGCIMQDTDHFMLNVLPTTPTKAQEDTAADTNVTSYTLVGGDDLKAHVNHKVEITGTMGDDKIPATTEKAGAGGEAGTSTSAGARMHTLNVKSLKMISTSC
jgi:hypothetical protein